MNPHLGLSVRHLRDDIKNIISFRDCVVKQKNWRGYKDLDEDYKD